MQVATYRCIVLVLALAASTSALSGSTLAQKSVIAIANDAAKRQGYDLQKYNPPVAHYQFIKKDNTWSVFYECKMPRPGCHFGVVVNAGTKLAQVHQGE